MKKKSSRPNGSKPLPPIGAPDFSIDESLSGMEGNFSRLFDQIGSFKTLEVGWNGYSAMPPKSKAINVARLFLTALEEMKFEPDRIAPSVVGGVGITFQRRERMAYVEVYNTGQAYLLLAEVPSEPEIRVVQPNKVGFRNVIEEIRNYLHADKGANPPRDEAEWSTASSAVSGE